MTRSVQILEQSCTQVLVTGQTTRLPVLLRKHRGRSSRGLHQQSNPQGFTSVLDTGRTTRLPSSLRKPRGRSSRGLHQQRNPAGFNPIWIAYTVFPSGITFTGSSEPNNYIGHILVLNIGHTLLASSSSFWISLKSFFHSGNLTRFTPTGQLLEVTPVLKQDTLLASSSSFWISPKSFSH